MLAGVLAGQGVSAAHLAGLGPLHWHGDGFAQVHEHGHEHEHEHERGHGHGAARHFHTDEAAALQASAQSVVDGSEALDGSAVALIAALALLALAPRWRLPHSAASHVWRAAAPARFAQAWRARIEEPPRPVPA